MHSRRRYGSPALEALKLSAARWPLLTPADEIELARHWPRYVSTPHRCRSTVLASAPVSG